jgi:hypothetical protein
MHHTVLNLFAAGVFHLFEQQAGTLLQDWTGTRPKYPFSGLEDLLKNKNGPTIDVKAAPTWSRVNELRLVANVVKHSEGDSADKLRAVNDAYFKLPAVRGTDLEKHFGGDHTRSNHPARYVPKRTYRLQCDDVSRRLVSVRTTHGSCRIRRERRWRFVVDVGSRRNQRHRDPAVSRQRARRGPRRHEAPPRSDPLA